MQKKELAKVLDDLAGAVGTISIMVYMKTVTIEKAHDLVDGMVMFAIHEHGMSEKQVRKVAETLHKELVEMVQELEEL